MSVFLSLLDKNNNGMINLETFLNGISQYGKKIKRKHLDEVFTMIGTQLNYIPVTKFDELYENYRFVADYQTSSDEEVKSPKKPEKIEKKTLSPEPKKENIEIKKTPPLAAIKPKEIIIKSIPAVKVTELQNILLEIKLKMMSSKLLKNKLIQSLFGTSFDPDVSINFSQLFDYLSNSGLKLQNKEELKLLQNFYYSQKEFPQSQKMIQKKLQITSET
jgi:hypothetical protein